MPFTIKEPKKFTLEVEQWTRETEADGEQMAKNVIEPLINNDAYLKERIETLDGNAIKEGNIGTPLGVAGLDENGKLAQHVEYSNVDNIPETTWDDVTNKPQTFKPSTHSHGKTEVGLENVDNTADSNKSVKYATNAGDSDKLDGKHASAFALVSHTHSAATQSAAGFMSAADKTKLDGVATGANVTPSGLMSGYVRTGKKSGTTIGERATAEGVGTTASGAFSHAEGQSTSALGKNCHAEGCDTSASNECCHAEGKGTISSGGYSHSEGSGTEASGIFSHAEGCTTTASGFDSHAEGKSTIASGNHSHAEGQNTIAGGRAQSVVGSYNVQYGTDADTVSSYFIVGNGLGSTRSNAFRVHSDGAVYGKKAYNASGADYAEYFEWQDGNPENEDRRGLFVTMEGEKIRIASSDDEYILGAVSGNPTVIGNSDPDNWHLAFMRDEFGCLLTQKTIEKYTVPRKEEYEEEYIDEDGNKQTRTVIWIAEDEKEREVDSYVLHPQYDPDKSYTPRAERKEWAAVGMLGVLPVRDDGTCQANGYCKVGEGGIATASESGYRVISRVREDIVKIVFR